MQLSKTVYRISLVILLIVICSCQKGFLDKKPTTDIVVPTGISDMMQLLEYNDILVSPTLGILSGDEYFCPDLASYNSLNTKTEKNCYIWNADLYAGEVNVGSWNRSYYTVSTANTVLDQWEKLPASDQGSDQGKYVKAWALYTRSKAFFNLVQLFSPVYKQSSAGKDLGIPLKLTANINDIQQRASVQRTYDQIINDLESSLPFYPSDAFPVKDRIKSSKTAVYALLSRVFLYMGEYIKAQNAADSSLFYYNKLIDYNLADSTVSFPFDNFNNELITYDLAWDAYYSIQDMAPYANVPADTNLIALFEPGDLRKSLRFKFKDGFYFHAGSYIKYLLPCTSVAVDEVYLIRAECLARAGQLSDACTTLNQLLQNRFTPASFRPFTSSDQSIVLQKILTERRKELSWRGIRWYDLKRLNRDGANITLTRVLDGKTYTLPPNDPRYVMPIPDDEISLSHLIQNIR